MVRYTLHCSTSCDQRPFWVVRFIIVIFWAYKMNSYTIRIANSKCFRWLQTEEAGDAVEEIDGSILLSAYKYLFDFFLSRLYQNIYKHPLISSSVPAVACVLISLSLSVASTQTHAFTSSNSRCTFT